MIVELKECCNMTDWTNDCFQRITISAITEKNDSQIFIHFLLWLLVVIPHLHVCTIIYYGKLKLMALFILLFSQWQIDQAMVYEYCILPYIYYHYNLLKIKTMTVTFHVGFIACTKANGAYIHKPSM